MKVHISIDMEGVAGVAAGADASPGSEHYEVCRRLMTDECNAAIAGAFDAGATEVVVNDAHGAMTNLFQHALDGRAHVIRGARKPYDMMEGVAGGVDASLLIGYHAAAGNGDGVLNHTMSKEVLDVRLNGEMAGELRLNAALAGYLGVPVVLVSGDDVVCDEARSCLSAVETVAVKVAVDKYTAQSLHPAQACAEIREGTLRALRRLATAVPYRVSSPATLRVEWSSTSAAAACDLVPGVKRVAPRVTEYVSVDYLELYRLFQALLALARSATRMPYSYD